MPCRFVSDDRSAHFSFKVTFSSSHRTKQTMSYVCHNCKKNDSLLSKLIKLEDNVSSVVGTFWHSHKDPLSPDDTDCFVLFFNFSSSNTYLNRNFT